MRRKSKKREETGKKTGRDGKTRRNRKKLKETGRNRGSGKK